ncbi:MAG: sugar phosphate isomerase/epimerase [Chloroflexi bacterium]|nr:sugar phosphate isomerase/epimerase [Chloroflexota bacterium]
MSTLNFAYSTINWGDTCHLPTTFDEIRSTGWTAVELFAHSLEWMGTPTRIKSLLGDLKPATLFGTVDLPASERQLTIAKNRIDYCAEIGASAYGIVGAGRPRSRPPTDAEIRELSEMCEEMAKHGASVGVKVAYHPHTRCTIQYEHEIDRMLELTQHLTLCLDVSHVALVGEDPLVQLRKYAGRLGYIHLKDWGRGDFLELGRGDIGIDFAGCLRELQAQKFSGWVVIEQSTSEVSARHSAEINAKFLGRLGYTL